MEQLIIGQRIKLNSNLYSSLTLNIISEYINNYAIKINEKIIFYNFINEDNVILQKKDYFININLLKVIFDKVSIIFYKSDNKIKLLNTTEQIIIADTYVLNWFNIEFAKYEAIICFEIYKRKNEWILSCNQMQYINVELAKFYKPLTEVKAEIIDVIIGQRMSINGEKIVMLVDKPDIYKKIIILALNNENKLASDLYIINSEHNKESLCKGIIVTDKYIIFNKIKLLREIEKIEILINTDKNEFNFYFKDLDNTYKFLVKFNKSGYLRIAYLYKKNNKFNICFIAENVEKQWINSLSITDDMLNNIYLSEKKNIGAINNLIIGQKLKLSQIDGSIFNIFLKIKLNFNLLNSQYISLFMIAYDEKNNQVMPVIAPVNGFSFSSCKSLQVVSMLNHIFAINFVNLNNNVNKIGLYASFAGRGDFGQFKDLNIEVYNDQVLITKIIWEAVYGVKIKILQIAEVYFKNDEWYLNAVLSGVDANFPHIKSKLSTSNINYNIVELDYNNNKSSFNISLNSGIVLNLIMQIIDSNICLQLSNLLQIIYIKDNNKISTENFLYDKKNIYELDTNLYVSLNNLQNNKKIFILLNLDKFKFNFNCYFKIYDNLIKICINENEMNGDILVIGYIEITNNSIIFTRECRSFFDMFEFEIYYSIL